MLKRLLTGLVIMALTVGFFALRYVSPYIFDAYVMAIAVLATFEVAKAYQKNNRKNDLCYILCFPVLSYIALILCTSYNLSILIYYTIIVALMAVLFILTMVINLFLKNKNNKEMIEVNYVGKLSSYVARKSFLNLFLMFYPAFILVQMFVLNHLSGFINYSAIVGKNIEVFALIMAFVTTIVTDTGAYLFGNGIKGVKLCPNISPKKTISGAIGGFIMSITFSVVLYLVFSAMGYATIFEAYKLGILNFVVYGAVASLFTQMGDIFASLVKRKNDIKDYGNILPGHGGVMDRVDGLSINIVSTLLFCLFIFL